MYPLYGIRYWRDKYLQSWLTVLSQVEESSPYQYFALYTISYVGRYPKQKQPGCKKKVRGQSETAL